jgi:hypothetical protein
MYTTTIIGGNATLGNDQVATAVKVLDCFRIRVTVVLFDGCDAEFQPSAAQILGYCQTVSATAIVLVFFANFGPLIVCAPVIGRLFWNYCVRHTYSNCR